MAFPSSFSPTEGVLAEWGVDLRDKKDSSGYPSVWLVQVDVGGAAGGTVGGYKRAVEWHSGRSTLNSLASSVGHFFGDPSLEAAAIGTANQAASGAGGHAAVCARFAGS
jgi:hypothetical protein